MEKHNPAQLELFSHNEQNPSAPQVFSGNERLRATLVRKYQKGIFFMVAFIFASLVSFSFGVERGKKLTLKFIPVADRVADILLPVVTTPQPVTTTLLASAARGIPTLKNTLQLNSSALPQNQKEPVVISNEKGLLRPEQTLAKTNVESKQKASKKEKSKTNNYTVQVASLAHSKHVPKELAQLKTKGYSAFSLEKGKYSVICVGKFGIEAEAHTMLQKLKSRYPDCQIRRL